MERTEKLSQKSEGVAQLLWQEEKNGGNAAFRKRNSPTMQTNYTQQKLLKNIG